jgi:hypothetical protein
MAMHLTHDEAIQVASECAPFFIPSLPFPGMNTPWPGVCTKCGMAIRPRLYTLRRGMGCNYCAGRAVDDAIAQGTAMRAGLEPLEPFPGSANKWKCRCTGCGRETVPRYTAFKKLGSYGCRSCAQKARGKARSQEEAMALAREFAPNFQPSVPYLGSNSPWPGVCVACGMPIKPRLTDVMKGQGACRYCVRRAVDTAIVLGTAMRAGLEPMEPFPGARQPWLCRCTSCGKAIHPVYDRFRALGSMGCQFCAQSASQRRQAESGVFPRIRAEAEAEGYVVRGFEYRPRFRTDRPGMYESWLLGTCPEHGDFEQRVVNFTSQGSRCQRCGLIKRGTSKSATGRARIEQICAAEGIVVRGWEMRAKSNGEDASWLLATCPQGHDFEMISGNFASGKRCAECADWGFNPESPTIFYVVGNERWLKCGVANFTNAAYRLRQHEAQGLATIAHSEHPTGRDALTVENDWKSFVRTVPTDHRPFQDDIPDGYTEAVRNLPQYLRHALILVGQDVGVQSERLERIRR